MYAKLLAHCAMVGLLAALVGCGGGGGGTATPAASNSTPSPAIKAGGDVRIAAVGGGVDATLGALVTLDASGSSDADNDALSFAWTLVDKPSASTLTVADPSARTIEFRPDQLGKYTFSLTVKDPAGAGATQQVVVNVNNTPPSSNVVITPAFTAVPFVAAEVPVTQGATVVLNAAASVDPDGDPLVVNFELTDRPPGSAAQLATSGATSRLSIDALGVFRVKLVGSDGRGGSFVSTYTFRANNLSPQATISVQADFAATPVIAQVQAMTLGATIALDATQSVDPDGDPVSVEFFQVSAPMGSSAALQTFDKLTYLQPDALGIYVVKAVGHDGRGGTFESRYTFRVDNQSPNPVLLSSITSGVTSAGERSMFASVGYDLHLDGSTSQDPDGDLLRYSWSLVSAPPTSSAQLSDLSAPSITLTPDVLGDYVVMLTTTDPSGAASSYTLTVVVNNRRPLADLSSNATPQALANAASMTLPLGTEVTLRGGNSTDADGDVLTYLWSVVSSPFGSAAHLSSTSSVATVFTPDLEGSYSVKLRVADPKGAFSEKLIVLNVGNRAPVAVLNRTRMMTLLGDTATVSAANSYDVDGDSKFYQWSLDAKPVGSTSAQLAANGADLNFTPDVPGTYVVTATVSDGKLQSSASVEIKVMNSLSNLTSLPFVPAEMYYSRGLDQVVSWAYFGSNLYLIDPFSSLIRTIPLSLPIKAAKLSPNGRLAAVLHEGVASLVDLPSASLIKQFNSLGSQSDIFVTDSGAVYIDGGNQWSSLAVFNGSTGAAIPQAGATGFGYFYGAMTGGVYSAKNSTVFVVPNGLSPTDISYARVDPLTNQVIQFGDSPYHGDYAMGGPLYLTENEDLLFTVYGNYFSTKDLHYVGALTGLNWTMQSMSHHVASDELLAVTWTPQPYTPPTNGLAPYYKRYTGNLFLPQNDVPMPSVAGDQSYAIKVFHSASGRHVVLGETLGSGAFGTTAAYHLIVR